MSCCIAHTASTCVFLFENFLVFGHNSQPPSALLHKMASTKSSRRRSSRAPIVSASPAPAPALRVLRGLMGADALTPATIETLSADFDETKGLADDALKVVLGELGRGGDQDSDRPLSGAVARAPAGFTVRAWPLGTADFFEPTTPVFAQMGTIDLAGRIIWGQFDPVQRDAAPCADTGAIVVGDVAFPFFSPVGGVYCSAVPGVAMRVLHGAVTQPLAMRAVWLVARTLVDDGLPAAIASAKRVSACARRAIDEYVAEVDGAMSCCRRKAVALALQDIALALHAVRRAVLDMAQARSLRD